MDNNNCSKSIWVCGYFNFVRLAKAVFILFSIAFSPFAFTQESDLEQLTLLNRAGMSAEAYALSLQMLEEWEGEPAFDLQYGVAAVDTGFFSEGIFALERVIAAEPDNNYARLELARAYFAAQEDERAKAEFEQVLASNPPAEVRNNIRPYLDTIIAREGQRRAIWRGSLDLRTGYDSNINVATDDDLSFLLGLPPGSLITDAPEEDSFASIAGGLTYSIPLSAQSDFSINGNLSHRENSSGDLLQTTGGLSAAYSLRKDANTFGISVQTNHFRLDETAFRNLVGVSASWKHAASPQSSITFYAQATDLEHHNSPAADALVATTGLTIQHQFLAANQPVLTVGINAGFQDAENPNEPGALTNTERETFGLNLGLGFSFSRDLQVSTSLRVQRSEYEEEQSLIGEVRDDLNIIGNVALNWRATDNWILGALVSLTDNDSNAGFTDYQREQFSLTARYLFR